MRTPAPARARPARLAAAISPNTAPPDAGIAAAVAELAAGSTDATVLRTGAAVVQPGGTDRDPTRVERPIDPATPPASGATAET
ncbi:hypothetical protein MAHJHV33_40370 [Mycobacterium avium subsp. hominissuis]